MGLIKFINKGEDGYEDVPITAENTNSNNEYLEDLINTNTDTLQGLIDDIKDTLFDNIYPVGSIYTSVSNIDPSTIFGGTWEQIEDTFLLSAGSTYTAGSTGGEAEHTLTTSEIPSHNHAISQGLYQYAYSYGINGQVYKASSSASETINYATNSTGGGNAHNNMSPYLVVYMWQRTA